MLPAIIRRIEADLAALRIRMRNLEDRLARRRAFTSQGTGGGESAPTPQAKFIKYVE